MKRVAIFVCVAASFFGLAAFAFAQSYTPLAPLPIGEGGATPDTYTLPTYLAGMIKLIIALAGAMAILTAIVGGVQFVASGITPDAKNNAKTRIENAFVGLALVLTSYLILNSISPDLVNMKFLLPPVGVPVSAPVTPAPVPLGGTTTQTLSNGGKNPSIKSPATTTTSTAPQVGGNSTTGTTSPSVQNITSLDLATIAQKTFNTYVNRDNDYSIITHCIGNTTEPLCLKADLNGDKKVDSADIVLFSERGTPLDVNQNGIVEMVDMAPLTAKSCFIKTTTVNVSGMLPREQVSTGDGVPVTRDPCFGNGMTLAPTLACNGATWIKFSNLGSVCAVDSGLLDMPFGYVYAASGSTPGEAGSSGQFSNFKIWLTSVSSAYTVNLTSLFAKTFLSKPQPGYSDGGRVDPYFESNLGKITYATIAQYDLNGDGLADFSASGADMAAFSVCKGQAVSGACAQADFNDDGYIDDRDLGFVKFVTNDVLGSSGFIPSGWKLNWFESMFFDPTGYTDKQILNYCLNRKATQMCGSADVDRDTLRMVNSADITFFSTNATPLDFNSDGRVDLR